MQYSYVQYVTLSVPPEVNLKVFLVAINYMLDWSGKVRLAHPERGLVIYNPLFFKPLQLLLGILHKTK